MSQSQEPCQTELFGTDFPPIEPPDVAALEPEEELAPTEIPEAAESGNGVVQAELFGDQVDEFKTALDRYGIWPLTVWPCDYSDQKTRRLKELVGDLGTTRVVDSKKALCAPDYFRRARDIRRRRLVMQRLERLEDSAREGCFTLPTVDESIYRGKVTASIFNPAVAAWILNLYAPSEGTCFDPFAGGGTRAILAAKHGLDYLGVELRHAEVTQILRRVAAAGVSERVTIAHGDARVCPGIVGDHFADFCMTCPPYYDLEQYEGGPADLSGAATYSDFLVGLGDVVAQTRRILKPGSLSCWVVGLHRTDDGELLALNHDVATLHRQQGFEFREEIVLHQINNGAIQRVGNFDRGDRRLIRVHEYVLVFRSPPA